ncbi:leukocyte elastase inhibitor [Trichonephila clavata]|uniref:Leukocyte elastase inhibitor n=1 Tax=Trichonephila clavata TaxID=2740835 RepID=A0A8X6JGR5_TRICU|nr:leukocyte elastase inhibitor [Trichonephila clavata]
MEPNDCSQELARASHRLGLNLLRALAQEDPGNIFVSPFSIANALATLLFGARDETASEINQVLEFQDISEENLMNSFDLLLSSLEKSSESYTVECANAAAVQEDFCVKDEFRKVLEESFHAALFQENFAEEKAVAHINDWIKDKTHGMISHFLDSLAPTIIMVLLNAVYFKGTWEHQFQKSDTRLQRFYNNGDEDSPKEVEMMHLKEEFFYFENETYQALMLPYQGEDIVMLILLPRSKQGLAELENQLPHTFYEDLLEEMEEMKIKVALPRFRVEYCKSLKESLQFLGMRRAFGADANLSAINECHDLHVSDVLHKAVIEVNEEGSEAAAATAVLIEARMMLMEPEFIVDHPFLFSIYNPRSNLNLFTGRIVEL